MTPEFNAWWDSDDIAAENPYDIEKPIYWAWEGWQAALKALDQLPDTTNYVEVGQVVLAFGDLVAVEIPNMPPAGTKLYVATDDMTRKRD